MIGLTLDELAYRVLPQVAPGRALADSEWRTLRAAAETLLDALPFEIAPAQVADNVERFLCTGRSKRAWRCRVLLTLLEFLPLTVRGRRFSQLACDERRSLFEARIVGKHGIWGVCAKIRYLVLMGAYGDECVPGKLGVWVPDEARPRRTGRHRSLPLAVNGRAQAHANPNLGRSQPLAGHTGPNGSAAGRSSELSPDSQA